MLNILNINQSQIYTIMSFKCIEKLILLIKDKSVLAT